MANKINSYSKKERKAAKKTERAIAKKEIQI
jgi:hypothetical protein